MLFNVNEKWNVVMAAIAIAILAEEGRTRGCSGWQLPGPVSQDACLITYIFGDNAKVLCKLRTKGTIPIGGKPSDPCVQPYSKNRIAQLFGEVHAANFFHVIRE